MKQIASLLVRSFPVTQLLLCSSVSALDFHVEPRLNTGAMYYEFEQQAAFSFTVPDPVNNPTGVNTRGASSKVSFSDVMPFVGGGATVFLDRFFVDAYAQAAFNGKDTDTLQQAEFFTNVFENREITREWDRQEYSFSAGYAITDNIAVFAGYRRSETDFEDSTVIFDIGTQTSTPVDITVDYVQDGPFVGGNFQIPIEQGFLVGALAVNLGLAFMEGEGEQQIAGDGTFTFEGDTVGLTAGLAWRGSITDQLGYTLGVDGYRYDFDADNTEEGFEAADFSETVIRGTVGLSYLF